MNPDLCSHASSPYIETDWSQAFSFGGSVTTKKHMAKTDRSNDLPAHITITSMNTKERVRQADARRRAALSQVAITLIPKITAEMRRDIEMGRPVINQ